MPKVITSPVERWAGSVTIADPLTMPQAHAIEAGMENPVTDDNGRVWLSLIDDMKLPAILMCVEKWDLKDFPETVTKDNFPASPRRDSHKLIDWIFNELLSVYMGEAIVPNE